MNIDLGAQGLGWLQTQVPASAFTSLSKLAHAPNLSIAPVKWEQYLFGLEVWGGGDTLS